MKFALSVLVMIFSLVAVVSAGETFITPVDTPGLATLTFDTIDCANQTPVIALNGELKLNGLTAVLIFKNNVKGTHELEVKQKVDIVVLPKGETIVFNKQPSLDGVGGNPWIYIKFVDGDGKTILPATLIGRCVQLSK